MLYAHSDSLCLQMTEHYWTPQSNVSNETSTNKTFQRTISAQVNTRTHKNTIYQRPPVLLLHSQSLILFIFPVCACVCVCHTLQDTLAYATALLNEKEQSGSSNGSDGSPANENADRSLRQVSLSYIQMSSLEQWSSQMTHGFKAVPAQLT